MRKIGLLLVCLAFSGNGRRMQAVSSQSQRSHDVVSLDEPATPNLQASASGILHPMKALGTLLLGFNLITGFKLSGRGVQSASIATTAGLHPAVSNRQGQRAPATGMNAGNEAKLLQRYLQLKAILPDTTPLSNSEVELLISQAEKAANPVEFDEERIWGEWQLVWQLNTKKATKSQKALAPLPQYSNFQLDESGTKVFRNIVQMTKNRFKIIADVKYDLDAEHSPANRLVSTISGAKLEVKLGRRFGWKPLRIPLPLKGKGWLDVTYLSDDMRITRGNRGSLFVHLRPRLLSRGAAKDKTLVFLQEDAERSFARKVASGELEISKEYSAKEDFLQEDAERSFASKVASGELETSKEYSAKEDFLQEDAERSFASKVASGELETFKEYSAKEDFLQGDAERSFASKVASGELETSKEYSAKEDFLQEDAERSFASKVASGELETLKEYSAQEDFLQEDAERLFASKVASGELETSKEYSAKEDFLQEDAERLFASKVASGHLEVNSKEELELNATAVSEGPKSQ